MLNSLQVSVATKWLLVGFMHWFDHLINIFHINQVSKKAQKCTTTSYNPKIQSQWGITSPVHTVSSCHNPAPLNQGSSTCVVVPTSRSVLKRDLRGGMKPELISTTSFSAGLFIRGFGVLLPARARSWVGPPHLLQPSPYCLQGTWAEVPAQPALQRHEKGGVFFFFFLHAFPQDSLYYLFSTSRKRKWGMRAARRYWQSRVSESSVCNERLAGCEREWQTDKMARKRMRQRQINNEWFHSAVIFLPKAARLVNTRNLSMSAVVRLFLRGINVSRLLLYPSSGVPAVDKRGCSFPCDISQVCTCGLSHMLSVSYNTPLASTCKNMECQVNRQMLIPSVLFDCVYPVW